jgi:hypothetical protein
MAVCFPKTRFGTKTIAPLCPVHSQNHMRDPRRRALVLRAEGGIAKLQPPKTHLHIYTER